MGHRLKDSSFITRRTFGGAAVGTVAAMVGGGHARGQEGSVATPVATPAATPVATPVATSVSSTFVLDTPLGRVQGLQFDRHVAFLGIPYAAPPVGELRWQTPQPAQPWPDPLDATEPGPIAPQAATGFAALDSLNEDCLYLNITAPLAATPDDPKPVMVWIHGGGGTNGSGDIFDARRLAVDDDVVVVTFNYRLGIFGAFGYPGLEDGGTFGLLDQQAALGWVRDSIAGFGGDPGNVTVFGESYGALSAAGHLVSPLADGLFHRAALQSSLALIDYPPETLMPGSEALASLWLTAEELDGLGVVIAEELGITEPETAIDDLRALPVEALLPLTSVFTRYAWGNRVLPDDPVQRLRDGQVLDVPVISGATRDEARLYIGLFYDLAGEPVTAEAYPEMLSAAFGASAAAVEAEYPLSAYDSPSLAWATIVTDRVWATATMGQNRGLAANVPVWAYQFADREAPPVLEFPDGFEAGAYHSAEVAYQFDLESTPAPFTASQWDLASTLNRYWANFARNGDPNGDDLPPWEPFDGGDLVLSLDDGEGGIAPVDYAADHHLAFWASLA